MALDGLIEGNLLFQNNAFHRYQDDFKALVEHGQKPQVLFIGCSDSRVVPDLIVNSGPGDMFILRNIGNFVPPFKADNEFHGSAAVIEYAVSVLDIKHIIICGHSHCGACSALYGDLGDGIELVHVRKWLELGEKAKNHALSVVNDTHTQEDLYRITEKLSILYQIENIKTYPEIKKRLENKTIELHGWYYKIEDGSIEQYDKIAKDFKKMETQG